MATAAEELLADFEDSGSEAGDLQDGDNGLLQNDGLLPQATTNGGMDLDDDEDAEEDEDEQMGDDNAAAQVPEDPEEAQARIEKMQLKGINDVRSVAVLMKSLDPVLQRISHYRENPPAPEDAHLGNLEDNPEYNLLTESNSLSTSIDSEIVLVHKFIRDHYSVRFPELETLVNNPLDYARVVAILGNGPMDAENIKALQTSTKNPLNATLKSVLDGPTLMVVTVEATTSRGHEMSAEELARVLRACEMLIKLDKAKRTLTEYVQSRMTLFAPNLTALVGSLTAAQLLNAAGGLTGLSKTPSCNISAWGSKKQHNSALASNIGIRQQGFLYHSPIIRSVSSDVKKQAQRIVSAKLVLAARIDRIHSSPDGSSGEEFKQNCLDRIDKLQEKPLNKGQRALPAPDDKPSRKRGGRRARKAKEATAMTDLRKAQNRMAFGKEEKEIGYGGGDHTAGMGMIGAANDGRVRSIQVDARTRARLSAKSKGWGGASSVTGGAASSLRGFGQQTPGSIALQGKGLRTSGVGTALGNGGTQSSLSFTPVQGLELVNPKMQAEMKRKREAEDDKWFKGGTFTQVGGGGAGGGDGVFKKPALPPSKKVNMGASK